jgi:hypothetical protein
MTSPGGSGGRAWISISCTSFQVRKSANVSSPLT